MYVPSWLYMYMYVTIISATWDTLASCIIQEYVKLRLNSGNDYKALF